MEAQTTKQEIEITIKEEPDDTPDPPIKRQFIAPVRIKEEADTNSPPVKRKSIAPVKIKEVEESNEDQGIVISPNSAYRTDHSSSPSYSTAVKRPCRALSSTEKLMVTNLYKYVFDEKTKELEVFEKLSKNEVAKKVADILGISPRTVTSLVKEQEKIVPEQPKPPKKPSPKASFKDKMDDFTLSAIRRMVHQFYHRNELPTLIKVTQAVNDDPNFPDLSKETTRKLIKHLNFNYATRSGKSILVDRPEIISWRQKYLTAIKQYRKDGRFICYQNLTWVNAEPTTSLMNATGNGKRIMVSHIGGEKGFIEGGLLVLESQKPADYRVSADFNAKCFEEWFTGILHKLETNSVVVIDNAPYNSRKKNTIPKMTWKKEKIQEWLKNENIAFEPDMVKATLLDKIKQKHGNCEEYAVEEMAKESGITVLRLPPYHSELNLIERIWAQVKGYIAQNNTTNKLQDVKQLLHEGIRAITAETWRDCIVHVKKEEEKMRRLDYLIDMATDTFAIRSSGSDSDSDSQ